MGEMADYALDQMMDDYDAWLCGDFDEETGDRVPSPFMHQYKPHGPGKCPRCGGNTHKITTGPYGNFYGCDNFPQCKGRRGP